MKETEWAMHILQENGWTANLKTETLAEMIKESRFQTLDPPALMVHSGDVVQNLTAVLTGTLHASLTNAAGKRYIVGYFGSAQFVNLIPVLDEQRSLHDIEAHEQTLVMHTPRPSFAKALHSSPKALDAIMRLLCLRSRALYHNISDSALRPLRVRCARMLLFLMNAHSTDTQYHRHANIVLKLTQDELADMIGRTRQSVNPELKLLEREGIIQMSYSRFIIRRPDLLEAIVAQDAT